MNPTAWIQTVVLPRTIRKNWAAEGIMINFLIYKLAMMYPLPGVVVRILTGV